MRTWLGEEKVSAYRMLQERHLLVGHPTYLPPPLIAMVEAACCLARSFKVIWKSSPETVRYASDASIWVFPTAYEGVFYAGRLKTLRNGDSILIPASVRSVIEALRWVCTDASPEALILTAKGERKSSGPDGSAR